MTWNKNTSHKRIGKLKHEMGEILLLINLIFWGLCSVGIVLCIFALLSDDIADIMQWQYQPGLGTSELFMHIFGFGLVVLGLTGLGCINVLRKEKKL